MAGPVCSIGLDIASEAAERTGNRCRLLFAAKDSEGTFSVSNIRVRRKAECGFVGKQLSKGNLQPKLALQRPALLMARQTVNQIRDQEECR